MLEKISVYEVETDDIPFFEDAISCLSLNLILKNEDGRNIAKEAITLPEIDFSSERESEWEGREDFDINEYKFEIIIRPNNIEIYYLEGEMIPEIIIEYELDFQENEKHESTKDASHSFLPKDRKLNTEQYRTSVKELVNMHKDGLLDLAPTYQRGRNIWTNNKKSLLIESLIVNIPLPTIYCMETYKEDIICWEVIDGVQRLTAIFDFYENNFSLQGLEYEEILNGKKYEELSGIVAVNNEEEYNLGRVKNILDRAAIPIVLIRKDSDPDIQFDIFARLNSGSTILTNQELRNCSYRGSFNDLLKELAKTINIQDNIAKFDQKKRGEKEELILTFFVFSDSLQIVNSTELELKNYKSSLKSSLDNFMKVNQGLSNDEIQRMHSSFKTTQSLYNSLFKEKKSKTLYLTYMVCFNKILTQNSLYIEKLKKLNEEQFDEIEKGWSDLTKEGTAQKINIERRHNVIYKKLLSYLNA